MANNEIKKVSEKYLSRTEREAISKLTKLHEPILKELEKWKEQREKLETKLLQQMDMVGKILKPYYAQSQKTLANMTRMKQSVSRLPNKKITSRKNSRVKKSR